MFHQDAIPDSLRQLVEQIKDKKVEMDAHISYLQDESEKRLNEMRKKIEALKSEENKLKASAQSNSNAQDQEIERLKKKRDDLNKKRQFYKSRVEELESFVQKQETSNVSSEDPVAALTLYKSIAPITISSSNINTINGMIAYGTIESTYFFNYSMENITRNQNDLWNKIAENRAKVN